MHKGAAPQSANSLPHNARHAAVEVLNACLVDSIDLYNATRSAHWNVKGPHFRSLHTMLEEFYTALQGDIDVIAERVVQLGGTAKGTSQLVAGGSRLPPYPTDIYSGEAHLKELTSRYGACSVSIRKAIDETEKVDDPASADLLTGVLENLDKAIWMMEAFQVTDS
jgi:starvation-inducible DNA-binding protein